MRRFQRLGSWLMAAGLILLLVPLARRGHEEMTHRRLLRQAAAPDPDPSMLIPAPPEVESAPLPPEAARPALSIEIPALDYHWVIQPDIGNEDLDRGPGHYPQTPLPGDPGNAAVSGHRTIGGRPAYFYRLDELSPGDLIHIHREGETFTYAVERTFLTVPTDLSVLDPTPYPALTLTTCDPPGSDAMRLIVQARLVEGG